MRKATTISCEADREYVEGLRLVAEGDGARVGRLVRTALDKVYGKRIKQAIAAKRAANAVQRSILSHAE